MPEVPPLEECELEEVLFRRRATREDLPANVRDLFLSYALVVSALLLLFAIQLTLPLGKGKWSNFSQKGWIDHREWYTNIHALDASPNRSSITLRGTLSEGRMLP